MKLYSAFRPAAAAAFFVVLAGCASAPDPSLSAPVRTRAPVGYQNTIDNYFAFKNPGTRKNTEINIGKPEPGGCPLDGYVTSRRGWVVPVAQATRTGTPGKDTVNITTRQYYFWFLEETIAGVTPRMEVCP
jgi:hypothetical protein